MSALKKYSTELKERAVRLVFDVRESSDRGKARFGNATFDGPAVFDRATLSDYATFVRATFTRIATFERFVVPGEAAFSEATFRGPARLGAHDHRQHGLFRRGHVRCSMQLYL